MEPNLKRGQTQGLRRRRFVAKIIQPAGAPDYVLHGLGGEA
jgi:hypothetical protein